MTNTQPTIPTELLDPAQYALAAGLSETTVRRALRAGEIPDAVKIDGKWQIPAGAQRTSTPVIQTAHEVVALKQPRPSHDLVTLPRDAVVTESRLGHLYTLEEAAAELGTTIGGIRRLGLNGKLDIGTYGPNGALRVWISA